MDENARTPDQLRDLPEHVRKFLAGLDSDDIVLLKSGMEFAQWFKTLGKVTRVLVTGALAIFGALVGLTQGWDFIVSRFFSSKGGG